MEKELLKKAFEAGWNSREPQIDGGWKTLVEFDDWYENVVLRQHDVIKSVCDRCEGKPECADNVLCSDCYSDLHGM